MNILQTMAYDLNDEKKILSYKLYRKEGTSADRKAHKSCKRDMLNFRTTVRNAL